MAWRRTTALMAALVLSFFVGWELYVRSIGYAPSYNDTNALWAEWREYLNRTDDNPMILVGGSRTRFDLDLNVMEDELGGIRPVMLAINGASGVPALEDLAADPSIDNVVVCNVTEGLFFAPGGPPVGRTMEAIGYSKTWTISNRISHRLALIPESFLAFLQKEDLSLKPLIDRIQLPNREGVMTGPKLPPYFQTVHRDRSETMWWKVEEDEDFRNEIKEIWKGLGKFAFAPKGEMYDGLMARIVNSVETIRERGGEVIFLRLPSTGWYIEHEREMWPRDEYWEHLLKETGSVGIHFEDYEQLQGFDCPEWSHLNGEDATEYTKRLMPILKEKLQEI